LVVSDALSDAVSVLLGNGDGTFQSPRQFGIGAFVVPNLVLSGRLPHFRRDVALADLNGDGFLDIAVTNFDSADVSVLLGRGDGTFEPQRRCDATSAPFSLDVGDVNGDGVPDLVAIDSHAGAVNSEAAVLIGRGDGTFKPQRTFPTPLGGGFPYATVRIADINNDGQADLVFGGDNAMTLATALGNGDGTFTSGGTLTSNRLSASVLATDINGDGVKDIISAGVEPDGAALLLGKGDGTFQEPQMFYTGQAPVALALADLGSQVTAPDGSVTGGPPDGHPDLVVADSGMAAVLQRTGPPEVVLLPSVWDEQGQFTGFGTPSRLASAKAPIDVDVGDLNGDGVVDVAALDQDGVLLIFGEPAVITRNNTPQTARDLGTVVHLVEPTLSVVPGHEEAYFKFTVPIEAVSSAGDEVLDFSALFEHTEGAGLEMELRDAGGNLLGSGERFRVQARQGEDLWLHLSGGEDPGGTRGAGAYTLDINVLPQVTSWEAQALLPGIGDRPGGPTTSVVLTLQGDRLDPGSAEDPSHYAVSFLGEDGLVGTADDLMIPIGSVVYNPSANVEVSSGRTYPTAIRQTVTLLFADALPAGSYLIELSPRIETAAFHEAEGELLVDAPQCSGHPVVVRVGGRIAEGVRLKAVDLVLEAGPLGDLVVFERGTRFLTQLQNDLGAQVDAILTRVGDHPSLTASISAEILERVGSSLGKPGERPTAILVLFLDPVSYGLASLANPDQPRAVYNLQTNTVASNLPKTFVEVGGNVEVIVVANAAGTYRLDLADVPERARGTAILLATESNGVVPLTPAIRDGQRSFLLSLPSASPSAQSRATAFLPTPGTLAVLARAVTTLEVAAATSLASSRSVSLELNAAAESAGQAGLSPARGSAGDNGPERGTESQEIDNVFRGLFESLEEVLRQVMELLRQWFA
jgi:hypothetical protein